MLRSYAFATRSHAAFERRSFHDALLWTERRLELVPEIDDPDHRCEAYESAVPVVAVVGRFAEAKRLASEHWEIARRLTAHHRVHSLSLLLELADAMGDWHAIADETARVVAAVDENRATPCIRNARDLFVLAVAQLCLGDEVSARELERRGELVMGLGHERVLSPPRLRMALVRGDASMVRELARLSLQRTFVWGGSAYGTRLDALVALGDREAIEREAPELVQTRTLVEPFALRALGAARGDGELLARADERFAALGLE